MVAAVRGKEMFIGHNGEVTVFADRHGEYLLCVGIEFIQFRLHLVRHIAVPGIAFIDHAIVAGMSQCNGTDPLVYALDLVAEIGGK